MKRVLGGTVAVAMLAAAALFGLAMPASAAGRIVSPGQSIQAAIDAASPGDTIILKRGTYNENLSITKDKLTIIGNGATLKPPATPGASTLCDALFADEGAPPPPASNGVCIAGEIDPETFTVTDPVAGTRINGLRVEGFAGSGIVQVGGDGSRFTGNTAVDDEEYGIAAFISTGTWMVANRATGSEEAGFYVGDSPEANAKVLGNEASGNLFGLFVRDAQHVTISGNRFHDNCVGVFFLADAPGPAGASTVTGNLLKDNNRLCEIPADEGGGSIGGIGIALSGAHDVRIVGNVITGNTAPAGVEEHAGVGVTAGEAGTVATGNVVKGNVIKNNEPDIFWDEQGTNTFTSNACATSIPDDLC